MIKMALGHVCGLIIHGGNPKKNIFIVYVANNKKILTKADKAETCQQCLAMR